MDHHIPFEERAELPYSPRPVRYGDISLSVLWVLLRDAGRGNRACLRC